MTLSEESMDLNWKSQEVWGVTPQPIPGLIGLDISAGIHFETISVMYIARFLLWIFCHNFQLIFS